MGRSWYEDEGKYLNKLNTFEDFGACARHLINKGITASDRLAVVGRSAGGLLIGAVCNLFPELYKVAVADVPFVDVMNTMSDPTIPLTVTEWEVRRSMNRTIPLMELTTFCCRNGEIRMKRNISITC
jgi:oligopeptidase B